MDTGGVRGIGVTATGAKAGATGVEETTTVGETMTVAATDAAMRTVVMSAVMPVMMDAAVTDAATLEAIASMAKAPSAVAEVVTAVVDFTVAADPTVADTGKAKVEA